MISYLEVRIVQAFLFFYFHFEDQWDVYYVNMTYNMT